MKPIKLVMEAFGSYGERTTVDFTKSGQNLFLITGDTGAGKSTIFDAIVFALYGKASSAENEKKGEILRSHYAALLAEPFVQLEFLEGEDTYTVMRIPAYRKLREKGGGKGTLKEKAETEKVSLFLPNGQEYAGSVEETNKKIEEITGLTKAQFMQIAMIAQGEFMKILREKSEQKKEIFRKLFHTEIFEQIVIELEKRKKEKREAFDRIRTEYMTVVSGVAVWENYESAENLKELKEQITGGTLANVEQFMTGLAALCHSLEEEQNSLAGIYRKAEADRDTAKEAYARAEEIVKYFTQLEDAEKALKECEGADEAIRQKEMLIRAIRAAYEIQALFQRYTEAEAKAEKTAANIETKRALLPALNAAVNEAEAVEKKAKKELDDEQGSLHRIRERVAEAENTFGKISLAEESFEKSKAAHEKAAKAEKMQKRALEDLNAEAAGLKERIFQLGNAEAAYEAWKGKNEKVRLVEEDVSCVKKIKSELSKCDVKMQEAQEKFEMAKKAYEAKNDEYQLLNKRYMSSRAKYFLDKLEDGKPCPICGSKEHPAPCRIEACAEDISEELLESVKNEAERLNKEQSAAAEQSGAAVTAWEEKKNAFEHSLEKLCESLRKHSDAAGDEITEKTLEDIFKDWKNAVAKEGKKLYDNVKELQALNESLLEAEAREKELREKTEAAHKEAEAANTDMISCEREISSLREGLKYTSKEEAEKELETAEKTYDAKKKEYDKAAEKAAKAAEDKTKTETSINQYEQELPVQLADARKEQEAYIAAMHEKDLSEPEWNELAAKHHRDEPEQLQKEVQKHGEKKASAKSLKDAAGKATAGKDRPDTEALEKECQAAQEAYQAAFKNFDEIKMLYKENRTIYDKLKPRNKEYSNAASGFSRLERLYKLFSGTLSGGRMDLETYVQRYYLEQILYAANRRFREMSAGQFELRMTDLEKAGEGKNKGLDLMVYSAITGKTREIRTLSGGESFMAALALSLGMADQIQQSAAALNLDIMFIDEGFGSLDEHSRSQAVKVLKEMAGGSRLVGIISHVTELKQEIDNQLLVSRDENGSHIQWQNN